MSARIECDLDGLRIYNDDDELVYDRRGWLDKPEFKPPADATPMGSLPPNIRRAVSEVLHAGLEHRDLSVRNARELLYDAVTYWPEDNS